jgi:two-component system sensor histidine kinase EvgS
VVLIDPLRFKQVVSNLLGNAIKFTATGQVRLGAEGALADDQLSLRLWVEDTGIGISADDQLRLFNPFIQGSNNEQSARSGSGPGVGDQPQPVRNDGQAFALEQCAGQRHAGGCDVDPGDQHRRRRSPRRSRTFRRPRALNILVVDDYPANRLLLARQLGFLGHRITTAEDGAQGLALWQAGHFDGVITDCNMPLKDGYTLARDIRAQERLHGLTPCLLLGFTANAQPQETERCRQAGMDGCLFKPTGLDDLRAALAPRTASRLADDAEPAFDVSSLIALTEGDKAALNELLLPLLSSLKEDRAVLRAQQGQVDFAALR